MNVAVVTDTTTSVPQSMLDELDIPQVSLHVGWDGERRPEEEYELSDFYRRLGEEDSLPTTSQPSVGQFLDCYRPLVSAGRDVVSIHIAAGISGTCASAQDAAKALAAEDHAGKIEVVDARTGAGCLGMLVVLAGRMAREGALASEVAAAVRAARETIDMRFCLDTLEYLRKGGRIGAAQAVVGSALKIKPILTFGTEIAPVEKVRTRRRAKERMLAFVDEIHARGATQWIIQHAQAPGDAADLVDHGREVFGFDPLFCNEVGPVLGAHLGAGMLVAGMGCSPADESDATSSGVEKFEN